MRNCQFCRIVREEVSVDRVYADDAVVAVLHIAPLTWGHALLIPREHHYSLTTFPPGLLGAFFSAAARLGIALQRATDADGFNLFLANGVCAGQVAPHIHLDIVPRFPADGLILPCRSVPAGDASARARLLAAVQKRLREEDPAAAGDAPPDGPDEGDDDAES
jgi:histidine triad (HIT) family protein